MPCNNEYLVLFILKVLYTINCGSYSAKNQVSGTESFPMILRFFMQKI